MEINYPLQNSQADLIISDSCAAAAASIASKLPSCMGDF